MRGGEREKRVSKEEETSSGDRQTEVGGWGRGRREGEA